jgi:hypothetical protein
LMERKDSYGLLPQDWAKSHEIDLDSLKWMIIVWFHSLLKSKTSNKQASQNRPTISPFTHTCADEPKLG